MIPTVRDHPGTRAGGIGHVGVFRVKTRGRIHRMYGTARETGAKLIAGRVATGACRLQDVYQHRTAKPLLVCL